MSMLRGIRCASTLASRARVAATARPLDWACSRRTLAYGKPSRFQNTKQRRTEVLEKEREPQQPQQDSLFGSQQQQQQQQQQFSGQAPSSAFPSYTAPRDREEDDQRSQWDVLGDGTVEHMRKVYGTLAVGIGIAAGASMFTMATPLIGVHPLVPGIASIVPLMGIMYTSNHTHSTALRAGLFAAFTGLSGMSIAPLCYMALKMSPAIVPQALAITTGLFGTLTALSLWAKPGGTLRWGVPLGGGLLVLMACGIGSMFVPVTSAWYPLLHSVNLYGGLALFTAYIAYDTQVCCAHRRVHTRHLPATALAHSSFGRLQMSCVMPSPHCRRRK